MRRRIRLRALPLLALLMLALPALVVSALDWPVDNRIIAGTFGEFRGDRFSDGLDIGGGEQDVHSVLPGELVFRYEEGSDYSSVPRGLGSFLALRHDGGIETIYSHLKKGSVGSSRASYAAGGLLGRTGDTGHTDGIQLHFSVYDAETSSFVNPLSLLPPIPDKQPPVIKRIYLAVGEELRPLDNGAQVAAGKVSIVAEAYDLRQDVRFHWPIAPYGVRLNLDGKELWRVVFDSIQTVNGRLAITGAQLTVDAFYTADGLLKCGTVELRPGSSHLILSVRDFAGNETTKEVSFTVRD